jgi:hypothetical protein
MIKMSVEALAADGSAENIPNFNPGLGAVLFATRIE